MGPGQDHRRRARPAARAGLHGLTGPARRVEVGADRLARWLDGFASRHGSVQYAVGGATVAVAGADGARAVLDVPFPPLAPAVGPEAGSDQPGGIGGGAEPGATATRDALLAHVTTPRRIGLVLLRRGGYAVGVAERVGTPAAALTASKAGTRYVQSRTAAGGWSQQRFARRRDNQTAEIVQATADVVLRLLVPERATLSAVVTGGDRRLLATLLEDRRLAPLVPLVAERILDVPDPRRAVLEEAVRRAGSVVIHLDDAAANLGPSGRDVQPSP